MDAGDWSSVLPEPLEVAPLAGKRFWVRSSNLAR
jgi:hypothetical protein